MYRKDDKCCSLGHCGKSIGIDTDESIALTGLFDYFPHSPSVVNDGFECLHSDNQEMKTVMELGDTPKERIINALCLIDNEIVRDV